KVLVPGCITHASVIVEHPELVAERIVRLARVVGRERVMASSDCGFASTLSPNERPEIEPEIVWAKFASLVEGARIASKVLWVGSKEMSARTKVLIAALAALVPLAPAVITAQEAYPSRPIRLVVGFAAGGPTDIPARYIADKLGALIGQRVIVENKAGAGGMLA